MWITIAFSAVQVVLMFGLPRHSAREQGELPLADPELLVFPDLHGDVQPTSSRSTTNTSVSPPLITPPAPRSP